MKYNCLTFIKAKCTTVIWKALIKAFISSLDRIHHMSHLTICQRLENIGRLRGGRTWRRSLFSFSSTLTRWAESLHTGALQPLCHFICQATQDHNTINLSTFKKLLQPNSFPLTQWKSRWHWVFYKTMWRSENLLLLRVELRFLVAPDLWLEGPKVLVKLLIKVAWERLIETRYDYTCYAMCHNSYPQELHWHLLEQLFTDCN